MFLNIFKYVLEHIICRSIPERSLTGRDHQLQPSCAHSLASNTPNFRSVANRTELTVKNIIKVIFASVFVLSIAAPAFAQSLSHGYRTPADQQINRLKSTA